MNLPCIKDKCLIYPACRNKIFLTCEIILKYYHERDENKIHREVGYSPIKLHEIFPNLNRLAFHNSISRYSRDIRIKKLQDMIKFD